MNSVRNLIELIKETNRYTEAYIHKYHINDETLISAIWHGHLAYLLNKGVDNG
jgi:hypothetical protein